MTRQQHPRIYFLHGLLATSYAHFGELIRRWRHAYQVVPLDLIGHGRCPQAASRPYYRQCVTQLLEAMAKTGPGHVVGASYLGGSVALRAALEMPSAFSSLILTGYVPRAPHHVVARWTESFFTLAAQDPELVSHYERLHGARWRETLEVVIAEIREEYPTAVAFGEEAFAHLKVHTLILNGSLKSDERAAAASLPSLSPFIDAGIVVGAGHIPTYDQPELFAFSVEKFWDRLAGAPGLRSVRHAPAPTDDELELLTEASIHGVP